MNNTAFLAGFSKAAKVAEKPSFFGVRPSTSEAASDAVEGKGVTFKDRAKLFDTYLKQRSEEEPISHTKALTTGGLSFGIPAAALAALLANKGGRGQAAAIAGGLGAAGGAALLELARRAQKGEIETSKDLLKSHKKMHKEDALLDLIAEHRHISDMDDDIE